jgi:GNAT superfamily N-acetyltransferase
VISCVASSDEPTIRAVLTAAGLNRGEGYTYHTLDGACLVHETEGVIDGVVRFFLGKPETWIRQLAVLPSKRGSVVAGELLEAVRQAALAYGSEGVEGFVPYDLPWVTWGYQKLGGKLCAGTRVRFLLAPAAASPSTSSSTATGPGTDAPCTLPGPSA